MKASFFWPALCAVMFGIWVLLLVNNEFFLTFIWTMVMFIPAMKVANICIEWWRKMVNPLL